MSRKKHKKRTGNNTTYSIISFIGHNIMKYFDLTTKSKHISWQKKHIFFCPEIS